ncbi:MAG: MerR family transcriptional regulator [Chitinophagaceae bacterium]|nr:MAG: MerR family transcriptional regulator [Chitinophagaceae bacterium]
MNAFTIKDLENLSGIKAHTIRMWEQRYTFLKPRRSDTNIRYYSNDELKTLLNIALLNRFGFRISHIDKMDNSEICEKVLSLRDAEALQERVVNTLVSQMIDLQTDNFEMTLGKYIRCNGLEQSIREIIFPFLEKIGILWQTGHIMPAQEHFVSNLIRQKVIVAIDNLGICDGDSTCILFLPEGEHHEIGLLFLSYLLKQRNHKVIYLGANVPFADYVSIVDTMKPQYAFIHLTATSASFNFDRLVSNIRLQAGHIPTIISGFPTHAYYKPLPACVQFKKSYREISEFISTL